MRDTQEMRYEAPEVYELGTIVELTARKPDKCGGTSDFALPDQLSPEFGTPTCE